MQEFEQVQLKDSMNEQGTSADVERKYSEGESGKGLPSRDITQECRDGTREVKPRLARYVKNRKGFLKQNSKRKTKENVGLLIKWCRRLSERGGVKVLSIFYSAFT